MDDVDEEYQYSTTRPFLQSPSQTQTQSQGFGSTPTTPRSNNGPTNSNTNNTNSNTNSALRGGNITAGTPTSGATTPIIPRGDLGANRHISHKRVHMTTEHLPGTPFTP